MVNYIVEKPKFLPSVSTMWNSEVQGFHMYKVFKKLKSLKPVMKKLNWKNGNLHEKVNVLRDELKLIQSHVEKDPFNVSLKEKECEALIKFNEAVDDEEKLLYQQAKVN